MAVFILRRLLQAAFTVFGVMLLSFLLFRVMPGDVSARYVSEKLGKEARQAWLEKHRLNLHLLYNKDVGFRPWRKDFYDAQFFWHLHDSATFRSRSYKTNERLTDIIADRAKYSLAITAAEMEYDVVVVMGFSDTANIEIFPVRMITRPMSPM